MEFQLATFVAALFLAGAYLVGGLLGASEASEHFWARRRYISAAAGISVAYIFVDVLPELELQRKVVAGAAARSEMLFAEQGIYVLALLSFVVMYGLQHMVLVTRERRRGAITAGKVDLSYRVQLGSYVAYSGLIGYLLVDRIERGVLPIVAYTFAMAVHFLIVDHSLSEEHGSSYGSRGRWLLAASVIVGWIVAVYAPLPEVVVARLFALLAGGVVITSLRAELPDDRVGRFWPFSLGSLVFAAFLMLA